MENAEPEKSSTEILDDLFSLVQNKDVKYKECLVIEETGDIIHSKERKVVHEKKKKSKEKKKHKEKNKKKKKVKREDVRESDDDCVIIRDTWDETKTFSSKKKKKHKKQHKSRKGDIEVIKERSDSIKDGDCNETVAEVRVENVKGDQEQQKIKTEKCKENNILTNSETETYDANLSLPDEQTRIKDEKNNSDNSDNGETKDNCRSKTRSCSRDKKRKGRSKERKSKNRKRHSKKEKKRKESRTRNRSKSDRNIRSRSNHRSSDRGRGRSESSDRRGRSERSSSRRSRSRELIAAAEKFEKVKKSKMAMKQHLLEKKKLFKIAKSNVQGGQKEKLDALTNMCFVIAKQGKYDEQTETEVVKQDVVTEAPKVASKAPLNKEEVVLYAFCTPSANKLKQSNENYIRILNIELGKCSKSIGKVETFWMSDNGYDRAWEKMSDNKKLRPFAVGTLASAEYEDDQKRFLPTTIKIQTMNPSKWLKDTGFRKTIFARASLYGDINIQDNEASGRNLPSTSFPTSAGRQSVKPKPTLTSEGGDQSGWLTRRSQYDGSIEHVLVCR